ncbi:MAG: LpqB family beta-propeller domain-containing protein [Acidobacteriota bacterium]
MADLRIALKEIKEDSESGTLTAAAPPPPRRSRTGLWIAAALATLAVASAAAYIYSSRQTTPQVPLQATVLTSYQGQEASPTLSPDGSQVAFLWDGGQQGNYDIYVKVLGPGKPLRLTTDPARHSSPSWSPDGRTIAFIRGESLFTISPLGGSEREIAPGLFRLPSRTFGLRGYSVSWSPDGRWILASTRENETTPAALFLIAVETGEKRRLTSPPAGIIGDLEAAISPDGRTLVFSRRLISGTAGITDCDLYTMPLGSDYSAAGAPAQITFDHALTQGIAWTHDSREFVYSSNRGGSSALWRISLSNPSAPVKLTVGDQGFDPVISRQGNRLAFGQQIPGDTNIWRIHLTDPASPASPIIASTRLDHSPRYSPDGEKIAFNSERSGRTEIWICDADGGNPVQLTNEGNSGSPSWSPDGKQIAFDHVTEGKWQIYTVNARGGKPRQLTKEPGSHTRPSWSHDGQWIYSSGPGGIQKTAIAGGNVVQLITDGGSNPLESEDGKTIYYTAADSLRSAGADGKGAVKLIDGLMGMPLALTRGGIYYRSSGAGSSIHFYSFDTKRSKLIVKPDKPFDIGQSVSPDGQGLLYSLRDAPATSDLMLVDPFR